VRGVGEEFAGETRGVVEVLDGGNEVLDYLRDA